ncbi:hypothetical protein KA977_10960 [Candidatus Dependentiae bacterium]|nr:hypothetical protein [Candidatus Dependentiae bacterium]
MSNIFQNIYNFIKRLFFSQTSKILLKKNIDGQSKKKIKVKHHIPMIQKWIRGKEQVITAIVVLALIIFIWFLYLIWGTWSPAKFIGGIEQYDDIELPGKNPYDKK